MGMDDVDVEGLTEDPARGRANDAIFSLGISSPFFPPSAAALVTSLDAVLATFSKGMGPPCNVSAAAVLGSDEVGGCSTTSFGFCEGNDSAVSEPDGEAGGSEGV